MKGAVVIVVVLSAMWTCQGRGLLDTLKEKPAAKSLVEGKRAELDYANWPAEYNGTCGPDTPISMCSFQTQPCAEPTCAANPNATCMLSYCGSTSCSEVWIVDWEMDESCN